MYDYIVIKQEEPCEARVSSTVPWECKGEIPSHDPISKNVILLCIKIMSTKLAEVWLRSLPKYGC